MTDDEIAGACILKCSACIEQQAAPGWPKRFKFPTPANAAEQDPLNNLQAELSAMTGARVLIVH